MLKCTIRDLLWLTMLVALGLAWYAEHQKLRAALAEVQQVQKLAKEQAERAEGDIRYVLESVQRDNRAIEWQLSEFDLAIKFPATDGPPVVRRSQGARYPFTPGRPVPIK